MQDADSDIEDADVPNVSTDERSPAWSKSFRGGCCSNCGSDGKKEWHTRMGHGPLEMLCEACYGLKDLYKGKKLALGPATGQRRTGAALAPVPEIQSTSSKAAVVKQQKRKAEEFVHPAAEEEVTVMDECFEDTSIQHSSPKWSKTEKTGGCCKQCGKNGRREWHMRHYERERQMLCDACYAVRHSFIGTSQTTKPTERRLVPEFDGAFEEVDSAKLSLSMHRSAKQVKPTRSDDGQSSGAKVHGSGHLNSFHGVKQHPTPRGNHCDSNPHLVPGKVDGKQYMVNDDETVAQICVKLMVRLPLPPIDGIRST